MYEFTGLIVWPRSLLFASLLHATKLLSTVLALLPLLSGLLDS
jgi:hypothetical protein